MNKLLLAFLITTLILSGCSAPTPIVQDTVGSSTATLSLPSTETPASPSPAPAINETTEPTQALSATIDEVIAFEMKGSFDFFWERANIEPGSPGYGLIRDRYPGSEGIASMASLGFGLSAYIIGVEKGYVTHEEAYERANKTMDTLLAMDREEGFYYHFVDMKTGKRAWNSEVSSIDTSILLMGVLTAGEYFGGEVQDKAQQIYDGVNWPWFLDESRQMFYMAYRPEKGFEGHWDFYAEQLMMYILAAGSDTHPVDETPYYAFTRDYGSFEGDPFIHSWFGSIFTYQFSHAWIDFRGYSDQKDINWFDNSVDASLAQVNYAIAMDEKYQTLGPLAWGLTACDGPKGYNGTYGAPPSGFDDRSHTNDDTVAPAGAIGSIIFVPEQAQHAMLNYYSYEKLKGKYGFKDAYNLNEDWFASDVIGIDKGISLLMLANYKDGTVYQYSMQNKHILQGLDRLQIQKK